MIRLSNVSKSYRMGAGTVHALRDVSLTIEAGEFVAIMGPSGSGKSTLMHVIGLLDRPDAGTYSLLGREVSSLTDDELAILRNRRVGFVFQQFHLLPRATAEENVALPLLYAFARTPRTRAADLLAELGMGDRLHHRPNELSGGQQQRVAIARALVNDPELIMADEPTGNLDSASAVEIMGILDRLNRAGKTVILVTHEPNLAKYARRMIRLHDGAIVSDERRAEGAGAAGAPAMAAENPRALLPGVATRARSSLWRAPALVRQALRSVMAGKVRSALSMLGILIGVAAVIAMLALGAGAKQAIRRQLSSLGSNVLVLFPQPSQRSGARQMIGVGTRLTLEDAESLRGERFVRRVAPELSGRAQAIHGNRNWNTQVLGTTPDYGPMRDYVPKVGRFFTNDETAQRARVAVIGTTILRELFGGSDPIGEFIRIRNVGFQVIGVLPEKGASGWRDQDDIILVPVTTAMYRLFGRRYVSSIGIEIEDGVDMKTAEERILQIINRRHRVPAGVETFRVRNLAEIQEMISQTSRTMSWLLASIAVISLLVGGIGIMNIMLVSVTERIREIGLRKAIGARRREILSQFLIEAVVVSLTGGIVGILVGWGATKAMSELAGWSAAVQPKAVALAFGFSALVGIVFGLWPARKAALLNPIDALRYE